MSFKVTPLTATSVRTSWQLPQVNLLYRINVRGFKLLYRLRNSSDQLATAIFFSNKYVSKDVSGLEKYTEYEFEVLAFTALGPVISVKVVRTMEDGKMSLKPSWSLSSAPYSFRLVLMLFSSILLIVVFFSILNCIVSHILCFPSILIYSALFVFLYFVVAIIWFWPTVLYFLFCSLFVIALESLLPSTKQKYFLLFLVPSAAPVNLTVASQTSTSILASWLLPPADSRNGIIIGFKLFYKRKGSAESANAELVQGGTTLRKTITGLLKCTEYEVQVLAFTAVGDGPKTLIKTVRTAQKFCKWKE